MEIPSNLRYTKEHEWVRVEEDGTVTIGITDYAQEQLGDIVFVELPEIDGDPVSKDEPFAVVESVKAVSDLFMPIGGEVVSVNGSLEDVPELVNSSPYGDRWIIDIKPADPTEIDALMDKDAYIEMLKGIE